jgi:hypothetical protein
LFYSIGNSVQVPSIFNNSLVTAMNVTDVDITCRHCMGHGDHVQTEWNPHLMLLDPKFFLTDSSVQMHLATLYPHHTSSAESVPTP